MNFVKKYWWVLLLLLVALPVGIFVIMKYSKKEDQESEKKSNQNTDPSASMFGPDPMIEINKTCGLDFEKQLKEVGYKKAQEQGFKDDWKEYYGKKNFVIKADWTKKYNIDYCGIIEWMYHIKYFTDWGKNLSGEKLFDAAQFQYAKQLGLVNE